MTDMVDTNSEFDQLTAEPPARISTPMSASGGPPPGWEESKSRGGTLNLSRAQHIVKKITDDPSWLIDPSTSHAANAVLGAATKVIGMNLQLEEANSRQEAVRARNSITGRVGQSLLKLAETGEVGAGIAAKWYALGDDGRPLYENPANASKIFEDYKAHVAADPEPMSMTLDDGTEVQGWVDPKTRRFTQYRPPSANSQSAGTAYPEPVIKDIGGKPFMFYRNFSPKPLDRLTPQQQQLVNVNSAALKQARKQVVAAVDDVTRTEAQRVYDRELQTFNELFDIISPKAAAAQSSAAPAASPPPNAVTTREQFDALAPGTVYTGKDGKQYRKP